MHEAEQEDVITVIATVPKDSGNHDKKLSTVILIHACLHCWELKIYFVVLLTYKCCAWSRGPYKNTHQCFNTP